MFTTVLIVVHVLICIGLVITVLLQAGKGGGLAGAFGGAGAQTVLGQRGAASFLSKLTRYLAIAFMVATMSLAYLFSTPGGGTTATATTTGTTEEGEEGTEAAAVEEVEEPVAVPLVGGGATSETAVEPKPAPETPVTTETE